jgi:hypothetical protein
MEEPRGRAAVGGSASPELVGGDGAGEGGDESGRSTRETISLQVRCPVLDTQHCIGSASLH